MKSMKLSKTERKEMAVAPTVDQEEYPYGLRFRLDLEQLKKLGLSKVPSVGSEFVVDALCVVKSVSAGEHESGEYANCELQITDLGLEENESSDEKTKKTGKMMYPKMEAKSK